PNYTAEYFIPLTVLLDEDEYDVDMEGEIGFDITLIDRDLSDDSARVAVWSNTGTNGGSWTNMDDCGVIIFDDATISTFVEEINLTGGEITENNGKLQIVTEILPENASKKSLEWTLENSAGKATIDRDGVVTGIADGEVTVTASALDGSYVEGTAIVSISNQIVSIGEVNIIKNPNFDEVNGDGTPAGWDTDGGVNNDPVPYVDDGILVCTPGEPAELWNYGFSQSGLTALPDIDYIYSFVAWADETRTFTTNFEDTEEYEWNRYGYSTDPRTSWGGNESDWTFDLTTEPVRYTFDVLFDDIRPNTVQRVGFELGLSDVDTYLDSIELVSVDDFYRLTDYTPVKDIIISGAGGAKEVTLDATLQMSAEVLPLEADYPAVKWSVVNGPGWASIDENGLLTPDSAG
ncbi:MAG: Ig-like domain-containing protein, partial [Bacteroidales bacterium]|nr:Ig-like domain-containing protein [Bacteroidales bacterium]